MNAIEKKRVQRFFYLKRLCELTDGDKLSYRPNLQIGRDFGWDDLISDAVEEYLHDEKSIDYPAFGTVSITHKGVKVIEAALTQPDQPTTYFPPVNIVVVAGRDLAIGEFVGGDKTTKAKTNINSI